MKYLILISSIVFLTSLVSCGGGQEGAIDTIDRVAKSYVKLALEIGLYDPDFVDAYTGPPEWRPAPLPENQDHLIPIAELTKRTEEMTRQLHALDYAELSDIEHRRVRFLKAHIVSARGRIALLAGNKMSFDKESKVLYDVIAPPCEVDSLEAALRDLEKLVPGEGELSARVQAYRESFVIRPELIDTVFTRAIAEARERTLRNITLPEDERFDVEYVTDASWGAYNWYKGNHRSLIQVNIGLPMRIGSPLGLAAHEGYPGHHVQNVLVESRLLEERGWVEYYVQPLYCPQAVINEGGANYATDMIFTEDEKTAFYKDVLFPLAGLDPSRAEEYLRFQELTRRLRGARTEAVRRYLDGVMSEDEAIAWLERYALLSKARAERYLAFGEQYRSYVVTYQVGLDLVKDYIEREAGPSASPQKRWELMRDLYAIPHVPSDLY
jgi:hypothetical protein